MLNMHFTGTFSKLESITTHVAFLSHYCINLTVKYPHYCGFKNLHKRYSQKKTCTKVEIILFAFYLNIFYNHQNSKILTNSLSLTHIGRNSHELGGRT